MPIRLLPAPLYLVVGSAAPSLPSLSSLLLATVWRRKLVLRLPSLSRRVLEGTGPSSVTLNYPSGFFATSATPTAKVSTAGATLTPAQPGATSIVLTQLEEALRWLQGRP